MGSRWWAEAAAAHMFALGTQWSAALWCGPGPKPGLAAERNQQSTSLRFAMFSDQRPYLLYSPIPSLIGLRPFGNHPRQLRAELDRQDLSAKINGWLW